MKKLFYVLAVLALLVVSNKVVQASSLTGDPDGNKWHITSVKWLKFIKDDIDHDDRYVVLIGKVTKTEGDETYWFNDGTGTVKLDSEDFKLPVGTPIVIRGLIDEDYSSIGNLEVDVRSWRKE